MPLHIAVAGNGHAPRHILFASKHILAALVTGKPALPRAVNVAAGDWALSLCFIDAPGMYRLNRLYRNSPHATDCLAFPHTDTAAELTAGAAASDACQNLGEIFLCWPHCLRKHNIPTQGPRQAWLLRRLLVHSFAHLLHFDHHSREEHRRMRAVECRLMQRAGTVRA